jgi:hypothetical protein
MASYFLLEALKEFITWDLNNSYSVPFFSKWFLVKAWSSGTSWNFIRLWESEKAAGATIFHIMLFEVLSYTNGMQIVLEFLVDVAYIFVGMCTIVTYSSNATERSSWSS